MLPGIKRKVIFKKWMDFVLYRTIHRKKTIGYFLKKHFDFKDDKQMDDFLWNATCFPVGDITKMVIRDGIKYNRDPEKAMYEADKSMEKAFNERKNKIKT